MTFIYETFTCQVLPAACLKILKKNSFPNKKLKMTQPENPPKLYDNLKELEIEFQKIDILPKFKITKTDLKTAVNLLKTTENSPKPISVRVKEKRLLADRVVELSLQVDSTEFKYSVRDNISILPENNATVVENLKDILEYTHESFKHLDVYTLPKKPFLRALANPFDETNRKRLLYLTSTAGQQLYNRMRGSSLLEILNFFSAKPPLELIQTLPLLKPRFYSICQSPLVVGQDCITIVFNVQPFGICTNYLNGMDIGTEFMITPKPCLMPFMSQISLIPKITSTPKISSIPKTTPILLNSNPKLLSTTNPKTTTSYPKTILFLANGTGISPFIGCIQHLLKTSIRIKLIYGYREKLFSDLIDGFGRSGVEVVEAQSGVHNVHTNGDDINAIGQDGNNKKYVQDYLTDKDLDSMIYVCGSVVMGKGVEQVLTRLKVERDHCSTVDAIKYWREERKESLVKELWG
jgi:sulfite reductase alpha subunit-like flavoprotein